MANQSSSSSSSSYPILCASFNQDSSCFGIGTKHGFKVFDSNTGRLCYERAIGAFVIVEMLFCSSLLAIVGAGEEPSLSPRRLCLFNKTTGTALRELNFLTSILAVRMNRKRLVVILQDKTYVYDINSLAILDTIDTVSNLKGEIGWHYILAQLNQKMSFFKRPCSSFFFSSSSQGFAHSPQVWMDVSWLYLPASPKDPCCCTMLWTCIYIIDAHRAPLAAIALSSDGIYIATASEQGTIIRVHLVSEATKSYSFRRGTYPSTIFSLSFAPSTQLPDVLVCTSSSGSVHAFSLGFSGYQSRSKRSGSFLGSIIPDSVTDALDPAYHDVLHNVAPVGVKSYAVIRKIEKVADASTSDIVACRATISIISYNGYFQEYNLSINNQNEFLWSLEREFKLLNVILDDAISL